MKIALFIFLLMQNFNTYGANSIYVSSDSTKTVDKDFITIIAQKDAKKHFKNKRENRIVIAGAFIGTPILGWIMVYPNSWTVFLLLLLLNFLFLLLFFFC